MKNENHLRLVWFSKPPATNKKRGISDIIVIVILVALVLIAIGVFWFVIKDLIFEGTKGISLGKFTINLKITNAYEVSGNIIVKVKRNPGQGDLVAIKFILVNNSDSEVITQDTDLEELEEKTFTLSPTKLNSLSIVSVSIAPVFLSASGERVTGDIVDTYYLKAKTGDGAGNGNGEGNGGNGGGNGGGGYCGDGICNSTLGEKEENCPEDCGEFVCTANCTGLECGYDPSCGQLCGTCGTGEFCESGKCVIDLILSGIIDSVWPSDAITYFDSEQLPKDGSEDNLVLKYVNFSNPLETGCIKILDAQHVYDEGPPLYDKTHVQLERVANIASGDSFSIYYSDNCGGAI